jgi:hypothetical protein
VSALMRLLAHLGVWLGLKVTTRVREAFHYTFDEVPQQLLKLVQQAHSGQPADLSWDIEVSPEMNDALCQPLTPEQLAQMRAAGEGVYNRSVHGYLISSSFKNNELSGVVQVSVTVHSRYSKQALSCPATRLRIVVSRKGGRYPHYRWAVTKVKQIA